MLQHNLLLYYKIFKTENLKIAACTLIDDIMKNEGLRNKNGYIKCNYTYTYEY